MPPAKPPTAGVPPAARDVVGPPADAAAVAAPAAAQATLESMAQTVRELWCAAYTRYMRSRSPRSGQYRSSPRWDGGVDRYGVRHRAVWPDVALYVLVNQLDPYTLVAAQFHDRGGPPPVPTVLRSPTGLALYQAYRGDVLPRLRRELESQKGVCALKVYQELPLYAGDFDRTYAAVLMDLGCGLSALFRYCMAVKMGLRPVAVEWRPAAVEQYMCEPKCYDEAWRGFLASDLVREADALLRAFELMRLKGYSYGERQGTWG